MKSPADIRMDQQPHSPVAAESPVQPAQIKGRRHSAPSLDSEVNDFIEQLRTTFPDRIRNRPKAFKARVLKLISKRLPPFPKPAGRPRDQRITRAVEMLKAQQEEVRQGKKRKVNWAAIALECVPGFDKIRSVYRRRTELDRLQNSVYARLNRKRPHKPAPDSSAAKTPAVF